MSEKEYIVSLNKGVDYAQFNQEMIASTGAGDIPNRTVDVANARPLSERNTHYALTDDEAVALRNDSRVLDVQLRPDQRDDIEIGYDAIQTADFNKSIQTSSFGKGSYPPRMIFKISAAILPPLNACSKVSSSYKTHPSAQTSDLLL